MQHRPGDRVMDWDRVWAALSRCFDEVLDQVHTRYPEVIGSRARFSTPFFPFMANIGLVWRAAQERETVVIQFTCGSSDRSFWNADGTSRFVAAGSRRHGVHCFIQMGDGEDLAELQPLLLPPDESSKEYEEAVLGYVKESVDFIDDSVGLILSALEREKADGGPHRGSTR